MDKTKDLALIQIESDSYFDFINISKIPLAVGDSAFIIGHPIIMIGLFKEFLFQSLLRTIYGLMIHMN